MARRRLSDAEREERRQRDRERLEEATRELLSSDGWQRWVETRRHNGLSRYSLSNQLLIGAEMWRRGVSPRYVAGYRWWEEHGYGVRRGEKAIWILAPVRRRIEDEETGEKRSAVVGFRGVPVFDLSQVDAGPQAVSLEPPAAEPVSGDSHEGYLAPIEELLGEIGCTVSYEPIERDGVGGYYRRSTGQVVVEARQPANRRLRVLLHEAAHALVDRELRGDRERLPYAEEEVLVETIGYLAASAVGLDTSGEATRYVASWADGQDAERIRSLADLVDRGARRLEEVLEVAARAETSCSAE